jgi:hypothetical protein
MSAVYNPEADTMAQIERLEMEAKNVNRRIQNTRNEEDQRVLRRQLADLKDEIGRLQARLP